MQSHESQIFVASVSLTEVARRLRTYGVPDLEIRHALHEIEAIATEVVPIDSSIAQEAFEFGNQMPQRLPLTDTLIATCARNRDATLVHRDKHMAAIPAALVQQIYLAADAAGE